MTTSLTLVKVHSFCPEEYIVFDDTATAVGYVRLRNCWFRVAADMNCDPLLFFRNFGTEDVRSEPEEQRLLPHASDGEFASEHVRRAYLSIAARKIAAHRGIELAGFTVATRSQWGQTIPDDPFAVDAQTE